MTDDNGLSIVSQYFLCRYRCNVLDQNGFSKIVPRRCIEPIENVRKPVHITNINDIAPPPPSGKEVPHFGGHRPVKPPTFGHHELNANKAID